MTGPGSSRIRVCAGGLGTPRARALRGSTRLNQGVLVVPSPTRPQASALATAILDALGATGSLRLVGRMPDEALEAVLPWLVAYRVKHLLLVRADRMPAAIVSLALDLAAAAGADLWVTGVPMPSANRELFSARGAQSLKPGEFCRAWAAIVSAADAAPTPATADTRAGEDWPAMPTDDFPTFRAAFHRCVASPAREQADALFLATIADARRNLGPVLRGEVSAVVAADQEVRGAVQLSRPALEEHVSHYCHALISSSATTAELTVRIRATQVAVYRLGWLMSVNLGRLCATADEPSVAVRRDPRTWHALRTFRYPYQGAICVLTALDLDSDTIRGLPASAVGADGSTVTVHGNTMAVPVEAHVLLRAQLYAVQLAGNPVTEPFIALAGSPVSHDRVRNTVRAALLDLGVPLLSRKVDQTWTGDDWLTRWGLALQTVS